MQIIPYARQTIDDEDIKAVRQVLASDFLTQGPIVEEFEKAVASYCRAKYAVAVNSGTSALHIACLASGLKKGDEGITSALTFVASSNCMLYCQAKPVFADIDNDTVCIDPEGVESNITRKTKVVIPVHFAGHPCDMDRIYKAAIKRNIVIIEDACHALGAKFKNRTIGSCEYSDMTVLSFHAVKHITTGEGGIVLTNNKGMYEKLKILRSHGITRERQLLKRRNGAWYYEMQFLGLNYRLTDFQCALGLSQLSKLDLFIKRRKEIAEEYNSAFSGISGIKTLVQKPYVSGSRHLYVIRFDLDKFNASRKALFLEYRKNGILVNVHYIPVYYHPYYKKMGYKKGLCPKAEKYYEEAITLPLYPALHGCEIKKVISVTKKIVNKFKK